MIRVVPRPPLLEYIATLPHYIAGSHRIAGPERCSFVASADRHLRAILSANENPYGAGQGALEAIQQSLAKQTLHRYPETEQEEILSKAIAKICTNSLETKGGITEGKHILTSDQLLLANGSDELISLLVHATIASGDNALVCGNSFPIYSLAIRAAGAEAREVKLSKPLYSLDIKGLGGRCDRRTKLFFVANPDNPTGRSLSKKSIEMILNALPPWVLLVLDAAYAEYVDESHYDSGMKWAAIQDPKNKNYGRVVMIRTFSKIYGLAAMRIGWALAAPHIIEALRKLRMPFSVNSLAIAAALGAIKDQKHVEFSRRKNSEQRKRFTQFAKSKGLAPLPSQANFVMLDCKSVERARALEALWRNAGFLTRSCAHNGLPHALRVTIGREQEMSELMEVPINLPEPPK